MLSMPSMHYLQQTANVLPLFFTSKVATIATAAAEMEYFCNGASAGFALMEEKSTLPRFAEALSYIRWFECCVQEKHSMATATFLSQHVIQ